MLHRLKSGQKGFTLVEILIVVALIAILAVIALVTINPAEAQKRARDARRIKELGTLQGIVEQFMSDNPDYGGVTATSNETAAVPNSCATGWINKGDAGATNPIDVCDYANTVPIDPLNRSGEFVSSTDGTIGTGLLRYQVIIDDLARYRICTRLESAANAQKLGQDGVDNGFFEVYSATSVADCS
ncbi:hypothetical protein A3B02_00905 [Candidatus Roizmanbacteria bacterium RIFCSPLOWO2_01_FULL_42_14]|nr:MAG: hypothetical protein A3D08_02150 [Candidatus Roizmanbacteria bacterium RIFCSPHIGHO2_02_FULL_43_11]OGK51397.1 MAG: hypothetical protein A3B02_00905 [Candidatus Roizmanbacteria bacterium RIFCSPLOWO2_01_FULL_42_14]OGK59471.1 MAG: hypothetical protein A3I56_01015 [Candidatus Roizmanbacteria bacterium RIFCSPLOWO2_02_FULL_43_10]